MSKDVPQKRVLILADFACATGFAQVAQNVVAEILKEKEVTYQIDVVGINYYGLATEWQKFYPQVRLFPATVLSNGDLFGRTGYLQMLATGAYDITWILQDTFNIEPIADKIKEIRTKLIADGQKPFKFIFYYPIDGEPKENWITKSVSLADIPVVYTKYGYEKSIKYDKSLENKLKIVPHGINNKIFYPLEKDFVEKFRKTFFMGMADNKFLVTNVNRNQPRKDIPRTMQIFKLFKQQVPNSVLYLHMKKHDVGWNIDETARNFELIPDEDYIIPPNFDENSGVEPEILNAIYNASDVIMTTSLGEGWGLSMTEAMATKTPVIAPNHTSLTEMLGEDRGVLVPAGKNLTEWYSMSNDNNIMRPLASIPDYVDKLVDIYMNKENTAKRVENAFKYVVENLTWDIVGEKWREIFRQAIPAPKAVKVGRNDPCPCGSGKKYKLCHYGR